MVTSLKQNSVVQKSIRRLRKMGFKTYVEEIDDDKLLLMIDRDSIINVLTKMIDSQIRYPKHYVHYDEEEGVVLVWFWKGEPPLEVIGRRERDWRKAWNIRVVK